MERREQRYRDEEVKDEGEIYLEEFRFRSWEN